MSNLILPKQQSSSRSDWVESRHKALELWKQSRRQVKILARVYDPPKVTLRHALEECDEFIRDYLYEPENMKADWPDLFFDFEKDSHYRADEHREIPDGGEIWDRLINKATSYVPRDTFLEGGKILIP